MAVKAQLQWKREKKILLSFFFKLSFDTFNCQFFVSHSHFSLLSVVRTQSKMLPGRIFHNFRTLRSDDEIFLRSSEMLILGLWGSKIVKYLLGRCCVHSRLTLSVLDHLHALGCHDLPFKQMWHFFWIPSHEFRMGGKENPHLQKINNKETIMLQKTCSFCFLPSSATLWILTSCWH